MEPVLTNFGVWRRCKLPDNRVWDRAPASNALSVFWVLLRYFIAGQLQEASTHKQWRNFGLKSEGTKQNNVLKKWGSVFPLQKVGGPDPPP